MTEEAWINLSDNPPPPLLPPLNEQGERELTTNVNLLIHWSNGSGQQRGKTGAQCRTGCVYRRIASVCWEWE
jgi:hypothetical protein